MCIYPNNTICFSSSESNVKPADGEAAESSTITAPTSAQTEGHQAATGEVNTLSKQSEETPPVLPSVKPGGPAAASNNPPGEAAMVTQTPSESPASSQDVTQPQVEAGQCLPRNGLSLDSTKTTALSPSSLTDLDLLEAVLDDQSPKVPEDPPAVGVKVQTEERPAPNTDSAKQRSESHLTGNGKGETSEEKIIHLRDETAGPESVEKERKLVIVKTLCEGEVVSHKQSDAKSSEGTEGWDVPDGVQSEELPSVSESAPPSQDPELKKQHSFYKRNKKKSNQGNLIHLNKDHIWNDKFFVCLEGKWFVFIHFNISCLGYFNAQW